MSVVLLDGLIECEWGARKARVCEREREYHVGVLLGNTTRIVNEFGMLGRGEDGRTVGE